MAFLPSAPLTLHGSCSCAAAKYTIQIPSLPDRPVIPSHPPIPTSPTTSTAANFPVIALCHCVSCRRASGALFFSWLVAPVGWVTWDVEVKPGEVGSSWPGNGNGAVRGRSGGKEGEKGEEGTEERLRDVPSTLICGPADVNAKAARPSTYVTQHRSSERAVRTFCGRCGTTLTYYHLERHGTGQEILDVSVGSLDEASIRLVRPERHVYWDSGVEWVRDLARWGTGGWMLRNRGDDPTEVVRDDEVEGEEGREEERAWLKLHVDGYGDGQIHANGVDE